ncbi:MAG: DUF1616 domain-containing protein [Candidatus Bathyarchaeota archaeon]
MTKKNSDDFMEKKIKKTAKNTKSSSYSNEEKTVIATIVIALVIMSALVIQLVLTPIDPEYCSAIYYLDSNKQTENLPKTVILDQNSTFSMWVGVENQNGTTLDYQVKIKIDDGTGPLNQSSAEAEQTFTQIVDNKDVWEFQVDIEIKQLGTNRIIFELFTWNATTEDYDNYTGNWVHLSVEAIEAS